MGGSDSKAGPLDDPADNIDHTSVADSLAEYPPPYIPERSRDEIYDPDVTSDIQDSINKMPDGADSRYSSLLKHLCEGLTKQVHIVTAIFLWMKKQDYQSASLDLEPDGDTPRGYMKRIQQGAGDYTTFFTILCRRSGIPCIILRGIGKDDSYYIGKAENQMRTTWAAVYVDDEWRLAHIQWALEAAKDGNQNNNNTEISDFYFLTDPAEFILICSPDDFHWQLLNQSISRKDFMSFPNFRPSFFHLNTTLISPKTGTIKTFKAKTEIELSFPKKYAGNMQVHFRYFFVESLKKRKASFWEIEDEEEEDNTPSNVPKNLAKYVFVNRKASKFVFEICLPAAGKYLFDIYGALETPTENDRNNNEERDTEDTDSQDVKSEKPIDKMEKICQFRLIAELDPDPDDMETNPDCPDIGWGPGPSCKEFGLIPVNFHEGCIYMKVWEEREVKFRMTRRLEVMAQLVHDYLPVYELVELVDCRTKGRDVTVTVKVPEDGRYALKVFSRDVGTKEFHEACVYLLRQRAPMRFSEKYRDKMMRSRLEHHVVNHTSEQELVEAMEIHDFYYVPDQGEKTRAQEKLKQYWEIKRELNAAVMGRNYNVLRKWIDHAKRSPYQPELQEDIDRAEVLHTRMVHNKGHPHRIARMDKYSVQEIRTYKHPPQIIPDVMWSTYRLLGEHPEEIRTWEHIQYLMVQQGKDSLQNRIQNRHVDDVDPSAAREADDKLEGYSLDKCRDTSTNIGAYYKWCKQFAHDVKQKDMDKNAREQEDRDLDGRETFRDTPSRDLSQASHQEHHPFAIQEDNEVENESSSRSRPGSRRGSGQGSAGRDGQVTDRRDGQVTDMQDGQVTDRRDGQVTDRRDGQVTDMQDGQVTDRRDGNRRPSPKPGIAPQKPESSNKPGAVSYAGFKPHGW